MPGDVNTENMMDTTGKFDVTDGRITGEDDGNQMYPDGQNYVDYEMSNSPFINQTAATASSKSKNRGSYASTKSKISTYRQRYYDQVNVTNDESFNERNQTLRQSMTTNKKAQNLIYKQNTE